MDTWEIIGLIVCGILFSFLVIATIFEYIRKRKKRKPQDHYYLNRKRKDNGDTM